MNVRSWFQPPSGGSIFETTRSREVGVFVRARGVDIRKGTTGSLTVPRMARWLALARPSLYWMEPRVGQEPSDVPAQTQFLLWQRDDGLYGVLIPLVAGDTRATLGGSARGMRLCFGGALPGTEPSSMTAAFAGVGDDPFVLVADAMAAIADHLRTFRLRTEKPVPPFAEWLGWCTWDAFYHEVTDRKIIAGLRSFARGGLAPRFVMLDDGWERISGDLLDSFEPDPRKFPRGLHVLIARVKREFGVRLFGIHHPFQGYWAGINPRGELRGRYRLLHNKGTIRPWLGPQKQPLHMVHPDDIHRFYSDWYSLLRRWGVDMVKVDGQSALELFTEGKHGRVSAMSAYQRALQGAAGTHFLGQVIPCMSNGSDVALHLDASNGWRNSRDYFPKRDTDTQKQHIRINALNAVWAATFALPDWDMFQSHREHAAFHAAARAISGGPVYVCDIPGKQNFDLLRKLCVSDGRVLRCDQPALPARDCLFVDWARDRRLLTIVNRNGAIGVLGLFHCRDGGEPVRDSCCVGDIPELRGTRCAVYEHTSGALRIATRRQRLRYELPSMGFELLTVSPIADGIAPLGLLDKYNGSRAVERVEHMGKGHVSIELVDGGRVGVYCA
ncbi:MAG: hypothetical protein GF331_05850, partial [Chitinivibrionales bacterium]|nr:hypothetical protein [Chitinivibrionales bacterium]